jgi:glutamyl-tRNA synthetase
MKVDVWDEESIDVVLKEYQSNSELSTPAVNQPIRIALTGSTKSPSLGLTLFIFGKDASLKRISALINNI